MSAYNAAARAWAEGAEAAIESPGAYFRGELVNPYAQGNNATPAILRVYTSLPESGTDDDLNLG